MGELVRQHRLLRIGRDPVEQIDGLRLAVVVRGNLLVEQLDQKRLQMEIRVDQAEFLQHDFRPLHALRVFVVVHFFQEILLDFRARGQVRLHFVLDGQFGVFRGKLENGRNGGKQFLRLLRGDVAFGLPAFAWGAVCCCPGAAAGGVCSVAVGRRLRTGGERRQSNQ